MSSLDPMFEEVPEEPARTAVTVDGTPIRQMSQAAVASLIYGTAQIIVSTLAVIAVFALRSVSSTFAQYSQTLNGMGTSIPSSAVLNSIGLIILIGSNLFSLLGIITGIVGLVAVKRGKTGEGLATVGLVSSIGCVIISVLMAQTL